MMDTYLGLPSGRRGQYQRSLQACIRCKRRKTKCSGDMPCRTCRLGLQDCIYPQQEQKITVSKGYLERIEAELSQYRAKARGPGTVTPSLLHDIKTNSSTDADEIENPLTEGMTQIGLRSPEVNAAFRPRLSLALYPEHNTRSAYLGISSSLTFGLRLRDCMDLFEPAGKETCEDYADVDSPLYNHAAWPMSRPPDSTYLELPPYETSLRLFNEYRRYLGSIFAFVEPVLFRQRLVQMYQITPDYTQRDTCLAYCQTMLVLAFGQLYSINQWNGHAGPPGFQCFTSALQLLPDIRDEGSMLFVEVLSLIAYSMQVLNRRDSAFIYSGLALRKAIAMGLHQELPEKVKLDTYMVEQRRRCWWTVYSMDRLLSCQAGHPQTMNDEHSNVLPPSPWGDEDPVASPAITLWQYTQLSRILGRISSKIYYRPRQRGPELINAVQDIKKELSTWLAQVPAHLRIDTDKINNATILSRDAISLFLHYFHCINLTTRPMLFHVVQTRLRNLHESNNNGLAWKKGLSELSESVIESCISAARKSTLILAGAAKTHQLATYDSLDGDNAFSAALVLVTSSVLKPDDPELANIINKSFDVLGEMSSKGNSIIQSQLNFLQQISTKVKALSPKLSQMTEEARSEHENRQKEDIHQDLTVGSIQYDNNFAVDGILMDQVEDPLTEMQFWEDGYGDFDTSTNFEWMGEAFGQLGEFDRSYSAS